MTMAEHPGNDAPGSSSMPGNSQIPKAKRDPTVDVLYVPTIYASRLITDLTSTMSLTIMPIQERIDAGRNDTCKHCKSRDCSELAPAFGIWRADYLRRRKCSLLLSALRYYLTDNFSADNLSLLYIRFWLDSEVEARKITCSQADFGSRDLWRCVQYGFRPDRKAAKSPLPVKMAVALGLREDRHGFGSRFAGCLRAARTISSAAPNNKTCHPSLVVWAGHLH